MLDITQFSEHLFALIRQVAFYSSQADSKISLNLDCKSSTSSVVSSEANSPSTYSNDPIQLLVGFSGGLDSTVLLHLCAELAKNNPSSKIKLRAMYIHHGLSQNADVWQKHCETVCKQLSVPFLSKKVTVDSRKGGIEAAARTSRYQAFVEALHPNELLLTAQHLDDQAETFLLAAKRGSGPAGLASMPTLKILKSDKFQLRPLLNYSRQALERYAAEHDLTWIEDESNQNDQFDRNFLRNQIFPKLNQRWPHFSMALSHSAELCAEQELLIDELLAEELAQLVNVTDKSLSLEPLKQASHVKRNALLRRWFNRLGLSNPSREQLRRAWDEVALSRNDSHAKLEVKLGEEAATIRRFQSRLYLVRSFEEPSEQHQSTQKVIQWLDLTEELVVKSDGSTSTITLNWQKITQQLILANQPLIEQPAFDKRQINQNVEIRFGINNKTRVKIVGRSGSRELKKIWQEKQIPPWQRSTIPLLYVNDELIMAIGVFIVDRVTK